MKAKNLAFYRIGSNNVIRVLFYFNCLLFFVDALKDDFYASECPNGCVCSESNTVSGTLLKVNKQFLIIGI